MKPSRKLAIGASLKLRAYTIIEGAVETGVARGCKQAHKHSDDPSEDILADKIKDAVLAELSEILDFGDVDVNE